MQLLFQVFQSSTDEGATFEKQPEQKPSGVFEQSQRRSVLFLVSFNVKA